MSGLAQKFLRRSSGTAMSIHKGTAFPSGEETAGVAHSPVLA